MSALRRLLAGVLSVSIMATAFPMPVQGAMLGTDTVLRASPSLEHARIAALLDRAEVRMHLESYGVSAADVQARLAALTDQEAAELAARIDSLPAGGIIGAIVFVFLVLLVTDILGFTKIFPFTRPIR